MLEVVKMQEHSHETNADAKNGREISVNGKLCTDLPRMQGGWEETHDVKKKHKGSKKKNI